MGFFSSKNKEEVQSKTGENIEVIKEDNIIERPRICTMDLNEGVLDGLKSKGFNIYAGSLGSKINIPNTYRHDNHEVLLNFDFPANLHEYDIFIIDLENDKTISYNHQEHIRSSHTGKKALSILSSYPETLFNPKPLSSHLLGRKIHKSGSKKQIFITFTTEDYNVEYEPVEITEGQAYRKSIERYDIYNYCDYLPLSEPKYGKDMTVCYEGSKLNELLNSVVGDCYYNQTFHHPTTWENDKKIPDPHYIPLVKSENGDIVSICHLKEHSIHFYFPQVNDKETFLSQFLTEVGPSLIPEIFPQSTTFSWKNDKEYWLPNHSDLLKDKQEIEKAFKAKLKAKDDEITANNDKFNFLHDMLTESGDKLVHACIHFFKWLEFKHVVDADTLKQDGETLEEDIQIELEIGLLIIECKGIGGTSTDANCSQISKIKHRRCKQRNKFDVFALYLVNHQRYLPPLKRSNPPFTPHQVDDAISDERGLLTTWQLYCLYAEINQGIITKAEAREKLLSFGLIDFSPPDLTFIDEPIEFYRNGEVCIVKIKDTNLKLGDELLIEKSGQFSKVVIKGLTLNDTPMQNVTDGEVGILLSKPIKKKSKIWKKSS